MEKTPSVPLFRGEVYSLPLIIDGRWLRAEGKSHTQKSLIEQKSYSVFMISRNSAILTKFNWGNGVLWRILKCLSSETRYSALAAKAQSTNLLSSGSSVIRPSLKCGSTKVTFLLFRISNMTFSAIRDVVCCSMISWYSSRISLEMHSWNLPARKAFHIVRYGLWSEIIWTRQLVSMTTCRIGDVIYKVCGNGHSEGFGVSARSTLLTPRVVPCPHQSDGHRNLLTDPSVGLRQLMTLCVTSR